MKVCDLVSKIQENYTGIRINEYKEDEHTGRRYVIEPHSRDFSHIPQDIWNADINAIVVYFDGISIEVEAQ